MEEPRFAINTVMTGEDYRKFLYIATFKRNKLMLPLLGLIALAGSMIVSMSNGHIDLPSLIISWIFLYALAIGAVIIKVERKYARRIKTDKTGTFDSVSVLKFYEDKIIMENEQLKSTGELKYDQIFMLMESKDYFIFYITVNQASLLRKKDIADISAFKNFIEGRFNGRYKKI